MENKAWYRDSSADDRPLVDQAKQQAGQVAQQARQAVSQVADKAAETVKSQLETQKERATGGLQEMAQALRETGESLRQRNQGAIGQYAESGAELVENFSGYFRDRNVQQIVGDVEEFGRRQATLFLGGAFALGFMLSRFLKSSSPYRAAGPSTGGNVQGSATGYDRSMAGMPETMGSSTYDVPSAAAMAPATTTGASDTGAYAETAPPAPGSAADRTPAGASDAEWAEDEEDASPVSTGATRTVSE